MSKQLYIPSLFFSSHLGTQGQGSEIFILNCGPLHPDKGLKSYKSEVYVHPWNPWVCYNDNVDVADEEFIMQGLLTSSLWLAKFRQ